MGYFSLENLGSTNKWLYLNLKKMKLERWSLNFFFVILWSTCYIQIIKIQLFHAVLCPYCTKALDSHRMWYYCSCLTNTSWKTSFCRFPFRNIVMNIVSPPRQRNNICTSSVILVWQWITTQPWPDKIDCVHTLNPSRPPDLTLSPP